MDAHLGKPIEPAQLIDCLEPLLEGRRARAPAVESRALRELTGGDAEFERELVETFVSSGDQCLADILAALQVPAISTPSASARMRSRARAPTFTPRA